ncbi:MAG: hypothetical protein ABFE07_10885 [Armatimonadia bacterium]
MEDGFDRLFALQMGRLVERLIAGPFAVIATDLPAPSTEDRLDTTAYLKGELRSRGFGFIQMGWKWVSVTPAEDHRRLLFVPMMTLGQARELLKASGKQVAGRCPTSGVVGVQVRGRARWAGAITLADTVAARDGAEFLTETRSGGRCFRVGEMDFRPETVRRHRERFRSAAAASATRVLSASLYHLHAYAGNPPPMLPKNGLTRFSGDLPGIGSLIACIPFTLPDHPE